MSNTLTHVILSVTEQPLIQEKIVLKHPRYSISNELLITGDVQLKENFND